MAPSGDPIVEPDCVNAGEILLLGKSTSAVF